MALRTPSAPKPPEPFSAPTSGPEPYLRRLRARTVEKNPLAALADSDVVSSAYVRLSHALADFVDAARAHPDLGYGKALGVLLGLVGGFPAVKDASTRDLDRMPTVEEPKR